MINFRFKVGRGSSSCNGAEASVKAGDALLESGLGLLFLEFSGELLLCSFLLFKDIIGLGFLLILLSGLLEVFEVNINVVLDIEIVINHLALVDRLTHCGVGEVWRINEGGDWEPFLRN